MLDNDGWAGREHFIRGVESLGMAMLYFLLPVGSMCSVLGGSGQILRTATRLERLLLFLLADVGMTN